MNHDFCRQFFTQISEFSQHFFRIAVIQRRLQIGIIVFLPAHQDSPVHFVFRSQKMHVASCGNRFADQLTDFTDAPVVFLQLLLVRNLAVANQELIVGAGLNLKKIVELGNALQLFI